MEIWHGPHPRRGYSAAEAQELERQGWAGQAAQENATVSADPFVLLTSLAIATSRLGVATGVVNPATRHPAVMAAAALGVQEASQGRLVLGIGRGDSALADLGMAPMPVRDFERAVTAIQLLVSGIPVPFDDGPSIDGLPIGRHASEVALRWLRADLPKVPIDVAATGPRILGIAGRVADRVSISVGADPERLRWAIARVHEGAATARLGHLGPIQIGAWINIVVADDDERARELARGAITSTARFSAMHGTPVGPFVGEDAEVLRAIVDAYDMRAHGRSGNPASARIPTSFIDRFAVVGTPRRVRERLLRLRELGLRHIVMIGASPGTDPAEEAHSRALFVEDVLPALA